MVITLLILGAAIVLFVSGKIRSDLVALCALLSLVLFEVLTPEEALSGFSSTIVVMMIGLFIVGGGIFQTGLANMVSNRIVLLAGSSPFRLYVLVMLTACVIGAFVSNTGVVAMLLPVVVSLAATAGMSSSRLLMPMAFASSMGGMLTLIGTPPNLVISDELVKAGFEPLSFFSFTPVGLICVATGMLVLWPLSKKYLSKNTKQEKERKHQKTLLELTRDYQLAKSLYRVHIKFGSPLVNKKIREMRLGERYGITILEIVKKSKKHIPFSKAFYQKVVSPDTVLEYGDILYVSGSLTSIESLVKDNKLAFDDYGADGSPVPFTGNLMFDEVGLAEVVVLSNSRLVNQTVKESLFRQNYRLNILGIHRRNRYLVDNIKDETIRAGDALLVQGEWKNIDRLSGASNEWVVVGQPLTEASKITIDHKAPLAASIMVAMVMLMAFNILPAVTAVMVAAMAMVISGCLRNVEAAYQTINWESILLIGGMLPMSLALEKTGISSAISEMLVTQLGGQSPVILLAGIYLATSALTMFISNTATAVLFSPIAVQSALQMGVSPLPFLFSVAVAASMCFASPFSTPPNALVMSAGRYTFIDYVKVGLPLQLLLAAIMMLVLPLLFPF
ncbi:SLC13 family permease [Parapedobacter soli]|uniref:SLC13 family permease n=1 Tax=Parapedobacter soli TaxID=416955 RepID=UPI0021CA2C79|nr:SLC13 family permease [Parapedobacter soli]